MDLLQCFKQVPFSMKVLESSVLLLQNCFFRIDHQIIDRRHETLRVPRCCCAR